jgi:hypothetical protein
MRIKISAGAERDIADACDFYQDIDRNLATYFHDSISADIDSLLLYAGVHAKEKKRGRSSFEPTSRAGRSCDKWQGSGQESTTTRLTLAIIFLTRG